MSKRRKPTIEPFLRREPSLDPTQRAFERIIESWENNGILSSLIPLAKDAPYYRVNPLRLRPYVSLQVNALERGDAAHNARYVVQRLECSNVEPMFAQFDLAIRVVDGKITPQSDGIRTEYGWFPVEGEDTVLHFATFGPEAAAEVGDRSVASTFPQMASVSPDGGLTRSPRV